MRVLVVDDSRAVRARVVADLAETSGIEVVGEAEDGAAAMARIAELRPDAVVLDLRLPDVSGLELLPSIKALPHAPRVVVLTNHGEDRYRRECLARGADAFVDKASPFAELVSALTDESSDIR